ncbi:MAG TPA: hypothetical protein VK864_00800, partial [Longimicrobiales bacterium]|nr:hypothetical protein [Longimicrobiales bacterium]
VSPDDLAEAALDYASGRSASYPIHDLEQLVALFAGVNFSLLHAATREWPGRLTGIDGPGLPRGGIYGEIVAERR